MDKQELIEIIGNYIDHKGLFYDFKDWLDAQGYSLTDLGIKE